MNIFKRKTLVAEGLFLLNFLIFGCAQHVSKEVKLIKNLRAGGKMFVLKSTGFTDKEKMLAKYANKGVSGGENLSPPLEWQNPPEGTKSFAFIMVDHHRIAREFVHWLVINIPANISSIEEGASKTDKMPSGSKELNTTYGDPGYGGPRPPAGTGDHPYETTVYALNVENLDLSKASSPDAPSLDEFNAALEGKVLAKASLTGMFSQ